MHSLHSQSGDDGTYSITAHNFSVNVENAIHNDGGARALGFTGGLVSGVTVYAYMTHVLAERFGSEAFAGTVQRVAFFGPVYEGDALRIVSEPGQPERLTPTVTVRALKRQDSGQDAAVAVWEMERKALPAGGPMPEWSPRPPDAERPVIAWREIRPGHAFHGFAWTPTLEDNGAWCRSVQDDLPLYSEGSRPHCHPGWVLQQANFAFGRQFRMKPWIHVSSRMVWHEAIRAGDAVEVRAVPLDTWEKGGDKYVRLRVVMASRGRPLLEVEHKAIVEVAPR